MDVRTESTTSLRTAGASPPHPLHTERREDMPTEELLRLLNERLQSGQRNESDDDPTTKDGQRKQRFYITRD